MTAVRAAAVAGMFYSADAVGLRVQVRACLGEPSADGSGAPPKMLIVPHAGFVYSGPAAGRAYACLQPWAARIRRVVLLGPAHRAAVRGLALPTVDAFETPLGRVPIDRVACEALAGLSQVVQGDRPHVEDHSLEVQLPFLQTVVGARFTLLPLAVGEACAEDVAEAIEQVWGGDETLNVVSSDLSHYLHYEHACVTDRTTAARLVALATDLDPFEACGARALNGALAAARRHGSLARLLDLRNWGGTADDRRRVVGYAALALSAPVEDTALKDDEGELGAALISRARNSIAQALGLAREPDRPHPALAQLDATFVTLRDGAGELHGWIGRLEAAAPLEDDVRRNALAAAFDDPRFDPLRADEWHGLQIEVSKLEAAEPLADKLGPEVPLHFTAFHPDYRMTDAEPTPPATLRRAREIGLAQGLHHVYTGNVHDRDDGTTCCTVRGEALIRRDWHQILDYALDTDGACPRCGTALAGRFGAAAEIFGRHRIPVRVAMS